MSRLIISNSRHLMDVVNAGMAAATELNQRALITLDSAPTGWSQRFADTHDLRFVSTGCSGKGADRADRITAVLGSQNRLLVFATGRQLDAGLLAAAAGTLCTGGVLILDLSAMKARPSADYKNLHAATSDNHTETGNFNRRLTSLILRASANHPSLSRIASVHPELSTESDHVQQATESGIKARKPALPVNPVPQEQAMSEQAVLLRKAKQHLSCHTSGCLLISGRRGRGKSMLLTKLADWLADGDIAFSVTSNHQSALQTFRKHFSGRQNPVISHEQALQKTGSVLLLDEASNMSIRQLHIFLTNYQHVVLSTTTEGYENAGRAFIVRFTEQIKILDRPTLQLRPEWPWRWRPGDYLEQTIDELLLSNQSDRDLQLVKRQSALTETTHKAHCRRVDKAELATDECLLHEIHSLLSNHHYQYSVKDLQHLLDGASLQVWVLQIDRTVIGSIVLEIEGNIDPDLHLDIVNGLRRLPHQLLPQLLAQKSTHDEVLARRFARVVRIAVVPAFRRKHYASQLLGHVEECLQQGPGAVSAIGASFARDSSSAAFWQSNDYVQFNAGSKINPRTGTTSIAVLKSWDEAVTNSLEKVVQNNGEALRTTD